MTHRYKGLYYPFIHFKDDRWLKLTALYWDSMSRIVPETYQRDDSDTVRALGPYIENLHPGWVRPEFGEQFRKFISSNRDKLRGTYAVDLRHTWPVVPPKQLPPKAGGSSGTDSRLGYVFYEKMSDEVQNELRESGLAMPDPSDAHWIGMHPRLAHVYMTALADRLAAERGLYPLTDEAIDHVAVGGNTMERLAQGLLDNVAVAETSAGADEIENMAAFVAIESVLPADIEKLPVDKILHFRETYSGERAQFQKDIAAFVKPREWLSDIRDPHLLAQAIQSEFDKELKPKLAVLREKHRAVGIDTVSGVLTMQVGVPAAVTQGAALLGLAANPVLAVGAGAALALARVLRDRRKARGELAAANLSYMLRIERDLTPNRVIEWIRSSGGLFRFWSPRPA